MNIPKPPKIQMSDKARKPVKLILGVVIAMLLGALGLELGGTDWDLGRLWDTKSFDQSKMVRDDKGNILGGLYRDINGDIVTDPKMGKLTDQYNCADFSTYEQAKNFFDKAGGVKKDVYRLDGDNDGIPCEDLPRSK
jgi:hypothetical protein